MSINIFCMFSVALFTLRGNKPGFALGTTAATTMVQFRLGPAILLVHELVDMYRRNSPGNGYWIWRMPMLLIPPTSQVSSLSPPSPTAFLPRSTLIHPFCTWHSWSGMCRIPGPAWLLVSAGKLWPFAGLLSKNAVHYGAHHGPLVTACTFRMHVRPACSLHRIGPQTC